MNMYLNDLWEELRLRTAPWGDDDWEVGSVSADTSIQDEPVGSESEEGEHEDSTSTVSSNGLSMSGAPFNVRIQPGTLHLLDPVSHKMHRDAIVTDPGVETPHTLCLRGLVRAGSQIQHPTT